MLARSFKISIDRSDPPPKIGKIRWDCNSKCCRATLSSSPSVLDSDLVAGFSSHRVGALSESNRLAWAVNHYDDHEWNPGFSLCWIVHCFSKILYKEIGATCASRWLHSTFWRSEQSCCSHYKFNIKDVRDKTLDRTGMHNMSSYELKKRRISCLHVLCLSWRLARHPQARLGVFTKSTCRSKSVRDTATAVLCAGAWPALQSTRISCKVALLDLVHSLQSTVLFRAEHSMHVLQMQSPTHSLQAMMQSFCRFFVNISSYPRLLSWLNFFWIRTTNPP